MKKGVGVVIAAALIVCAAAVGITYRNKKLKAEMEKTLNVSTVYNGITVNGVNIGGMSVEDACQTLQSQINSEFDNIYVTLTKDDKNWKYKFSDFGARYAVESTVAEAFKYGREGTEKERYKLVKALEKKPEDFESEYTYDKEKVNSTMLALDGEVSQEAVNSKLSRESGRFVISDSQQGYKMDAAKTSADVCAALSTMADASVAISGNVVEPSVTREDNEKATSLIGSYSTNYSGGNAGRNENLRVGCLNINGTIVKPGETFSMNVGLGPQTYANGYRDAAVIVNGKIENDVAGGVCQVTSTLYNAVIRAELPIVQRSNHSLTVSYVPLGLDAAVAGDYKDLKFKNDTEYPVYIEAYTTGSKVVCNVYGHEIHDSGRKVEFETVLTGTIEKPAEVVTEDPDLPEGTRTVTRYGKEGKKVDTYKKVYENGKLVSNEYFSSSTYKATADEVTVGTKKAETKTENSAENTNTSSGESGGSIFQ